MKQTNRTDRAATQGRSYTRATTVRRGGPAWPPAVLLIVTATLISSTLTTRHAIGFTTSAQQVIQSMECRWADSAIKIDGKLDDAAWKKAQVVRQFVVPRQTRAPKTGTAFRTAWDTRYLYFAAEMQDADLFGDLTKRNDQTWNNDVIELFIKPLEKKLHYYEFQVTPRNTPLELFFPSRGAGGYPRFAPLTRLGMQTAVTLDGTLNDWRDDDKSWTAEGRLPWKAFEATTGRPKPGDSWRFAACRYDWSKDFESPELSTTANVRAGSFHSYEDYAALKFVGP